MGILPGSRLHASDGVMQNFESEIQAIFEQTRDSVVQVKTILQVKDTQKGDVLSEALSFGSGFFVDKEGRLFTAASVLRGSKEAMVIWKGKQYVAQMIGQDPRTNLAMLKIDAETPSLPMGDPQTLKVGSMSIAVGYPAEAPITAEYGIISDVGGAQIHPNFATAHIRSSVRAQPGQSGSPFLNSKGEVMGMVVCSTEDGGSTYALPINAARKIMKDFLQFHEARHGWTGMTIEVKGSSETPNGRIAIRDVYEGYPGQKAGILAGDYLIKIGDYPILSPADVMNATFYLSIDEKVNFTIERGGKTMTLPVRVVKRPSGSEMQTLKLVPATKSTSSNPQAQATTP